MTFPKPHYLVMGIPIPYVRLALLLQRCVFVSITASSKLFRMLGK